MNTSLVRSRAMLSRFDADAGAWDIIPDGAFVQEDGTIVEVGRYEELATRYPSVPVIGTGREILLPGFVNSHHHVGLTPVQLGSPDMPLELWAVTRMVARSVNLYLDTLYSAFEMIGSGITTVQHLQGRLPGDLKELESRSLDVIRAYQDIGMRVSFSYGIRVQNRLLHQDDAEFLRSLPDRLRAPMSRWFERFRTGIDDFLLLFETLHRRFDAERRVAIQLAPTNLHWCSDEALSKTALVAQKYDAPIHMHLVETLYQREYALRRGGCTALEYIDRFGLLGSKTTLGHGVWLTDSDIARVAETGTCICHNCSSNYRLRSGLAPLMKFKKAKLTVAIGLDEAGINDDRDMWQEMRLILNAHRRPGMRDEDVPVPAEILHMATEQGALTTPFAGRIGALAVGRMADAVLFDWDQVAYPYLDENISIAEALVYRGKSHGVRTVICDGRVIYRDGRFTQCDRDQALRALHDELAFAISSDELERRQLAREILPYVKRYYDSYDAPNAVTLT